jgi:hypothetical protein
MISGEPKSVTKPMIWTAWNNGRHDKSGNGYGFKVPISDRDRFFDRSRYTAVLLLSGSNVEIRVNTRKKSFWTETCHELICKELGAWFIREGLAPWPAGRPPKILLSALGEGRFRILGPARMDSAER